MKRDAFLRALRSALSGLPSPEIDEIVADYADHFAESAVAGRDEEDVAAALGDPRRIARELRAELGLRRFEEHWSLSNLLAATMALAALAVVDLLVLLPLLLGAAGVALGLAVALVAIGAVGVKLLFTTLAFQLGGPLAGVAAGVVGQLCIGAGMLCGFLGGGALLLLGLGWATRLLGRYARLHFRLIRHGEARV